MSYNDKKIQLSDFMDTAQSSRVIDEILDNDDLHQTWIRYHLIGEAMRTQHGDEICRVDICAQVGAAIDKESTIHIDTLNLRKKTIVPYALAASVATLAIGAFLFLTLSSNNLPLAQLAEIANSESNLDIKSQLPNPQNTDTLPIRPNTHLVVEGSYKIERLNALDEYWARHSAASIGRRPLDIQVLRYSR